MRALAGVSIFLLGCAGSPRPVRARLDPVPTPSASTAPPEVGTIAWDEASASIRCRATGTELVLPAALRGDVRPLGSRGNALAVVRSADGGVFMVAGSRDHDPVDELASEEARDLGLPQSFKGTVRMYMDQGRTVIDWVADGQSYQMAIKEIHRHGATCRFIALEKTPGSGDLISVLESIQDGPGVNVLGPSRSAAEVSRAVEGPDLRLLRFALWLWGDVVFRR